MKVYRKRVSSILILSIFLLIDFGAFLMGTSLEVDSVMFFSGVYALSTLILTLTFIYKATKKLNFFFFFMGIGYIFEFGQSISVCLGGYDSLSENWFLNINSGYFSSAEIWSAFFLSHMLMVSVVMAYILCYKKEIRGVQGNYGDEHKTQYVYIGYILLILSIIPTFYLIRKEIITVQTLGYGATLQGKHGVDKILELVSEFFPVSTIWLLLFDQRKQSQRMIIGLIIIYMIMELAGGSRIQIFRFVVILFLIYTLYYKTIKTKQMISFMILGLIGVFALSLVSSVRTSLYFTTDVSELLKTAANDLLENNFITSTIRELGNTQVINALVFKQCPEIVDYAYGTSYLKMFFSAIPNFWGGIHPSAIDVDSVFSPYYTNLCGLGSSFVAEAYWNFGMFSVLFCALLGKIFACLDSKLNELCLKKSSDTKMFLIFYNVFLLIFWVRSSCNGFGRSMLYASIPVLMSKMKFKSNTRL